MAKKNGGKGDPIATRAASSASKPGYNSLGSHKDNPTQGWDNPFFRGEETVFNTAAAGDVYSPVNSVFGVPTRRDNSNVMEDQLKGLSHAGRGDTFGGKKGKK